MRLALHTDYALRTLIYLAGRPGRARIGDVARFFRISEHHVAKVVNNLARLGYVRSVRGVRGGIELGKPAALIRLGDVILAFEGNMHLLECVGTEGVCVIQPSCKLRRILAEAESVQLAFLNRYTLDQIVRPGGQLTELRVVAAK